MNLAFYINDTASDLYIGNVPVPTSSGYLSVAKVEGLSYLKPANQTFLQLKGGYSLKCNAVAAITAGSTISVVAIGGDF